MPEYRHLASVGLGRSPADRAFMPGACMGRIKIVAALLRQPSTGGHSGALGAFVPSYPADDDPPTGEAPTRAPWRQSDVKRAIAAAEQAGLGAYRVEIASDGTISIVVGELSDTPENTGGPGDRPGS